MSTKYHDKFLDDVYDEYLNACVKFNKFNSYHEGWAVIKEEMDELWEECRKWPKTHDPDKMRKECVQIAAMATRFANDLIEERK